MTGSDRIVADASLVLAVLLPEAHSDEARAVLAGADEVHAPDLLLYEVVSALRMHVVRGTLTIAEAETKGAEAHDAPLLLTGARELDAHALSLAHVLGHSAYDCFYLALAIERECVLVTGDRGLASAARAIGLGTHVRLLGA
ncbi:MAG: type II toxin-antitoxin system VapC family toxin [Clostridiales bacterium]|nr:type II toxin-antitoxin system VapC family toxin [Clostridiales bacterium]